MPEFNKALVVILALSITHGLSGCGKDATKRVVPQPEVTIATPVQQEVTRYLEYTGNTVGIQTVDIRARVPGFLDKICFEPRQKVKAGQLLFVIDPRQYEASVKEAKEKLDAQKAQAKLAQTELQINEQLERKEAISGLKLEKKAAERDVSLADVELAAANLDKAKLDLEWTQVTSPIDGRVSRNLVDVGNLVGATEKTLLTTVISDDFVYAYFNITELDLLPILRKHQDKTDEASQDVKKIPVQMGLADETGHPHEGHFDFADTKVDPSTGTVQVRGIFPNPDGLLMAGMFVNVRVPVEKREGLLVPEVAVQFDQGGRYVLVVDDQNIVQQKRIKMGDRVDGMRVIEDGLSSKDRVITEGIQRARIGAKVNPSARPAAAGQSDTRVQEKSRTK